MKCVTFKTGILLYVRFLPEDKLQTFDSCDKKFNEVGIFFLLLQLSTIGTG